MESIGEEKIVLDRKTFKALAVDTRVDILKELNQRRKTQTELSESLGLSVVTIKEHLNKMDDAGLIKMKDEGRKWKYYDLTEKGRCVLFPQRKKLWVILVSLFLVAGLALFTTFNNLEISVNPKSPLMETNVMSEPMGIQQTADKAEPESEQVRSLGAMNEAESSDEDAMTAQDLPPRPDRYMTDEHEVKMPWLQYISYGLLLFLMVLFIFYLSQYQHEKDQFKS